MNPLFERVLDDGGLGPFRISRVPSPDGGYTRGVMASLTLIGTFEGERVKPDAEIDEKIKDGGTFFDEKLSVQRFFLNFRKKRD